jgi:hypothetical protein
VIAQVEGVAVEEMLPVPAGTGTGLVIARVWPALRPRRRRGLRA